MKKEKFDVIGMTCSSCQAYVDKAVRAVDGVEDVSVNLLSNTMEVIFKDDLDTSLIIKSVKDAGYDAKKYTPKTDTGNVDEIKSIRKRLITSLIFWIPLMYVAMHHMINSICDYLIPDSLCHYLSNPENALVFIGIQVVLLIPILIANRKYFTSGFKKLFKKSPNMDSLIALGSSAAVIYGIYITIMVILNNDLEVIKSLTNDIYFESAGTILTLITVGKYLEAKSKGKTGNAISKLIKLSPKQALRINGDKEEKVDIDELKIDDIILVKPGEIIPIDGIVIEGKSSVDESALTGEPMPVYKEKDSNVISGTVNRNGVLKIKAKKVGDETTINKIIKLVEEVSSSKAPIARLADKVSGVFVPIVITIALITLIAWLLIGKSFEFSLTCAIAVLVISCPCALGLATPVAIMVATGKAAENGILFKDAESLENLQNVDVVVFDKTGTITEGKPRVLELITNQTIFAESKIGNGKVKFVASESSIKAAEDTLLKIAGSLEKNSEHPLAEAILEKVKENNVALEEIKDFENVPGKGIKAIVDNKICLGGNKVFMEENNVNLSDYENKINSIQGDGKICLYFARESKIIGVIVVTDKVKPSSREAISKLKLLGKKLYMISGDNKKVAKSIAEDIGIDNVIAEVLPQDKEKEVEKLQKDYKVCFVGDGINDSPALMKSDVGIAIGSGTDIAIESAEVVLMKDNLLDVVTAIELSKKTINNIKLSLFWAFIYNIIGIPVAAGLFYIPFGLKLNPMIGALAMSLSSVCVVTNALRLNRFKNKNIEMGNKNMRTVYIDGMHCEHCKMSVEKTLNEIEGIEKAEVNLKKKLAVITESKTVDEKVIKEAIEKQGFVFKKIK